MNALAQSEGLVLLARVELGRYLLALGVLLILILVAGFALLLVRRKLLGGKAEDDASGGVFARLRSMRDRGELSAEEYESIRRVMISRMREGGSSAEDASADGRHSPVRGEGR